MTKAQRKAILDCVPNNWLDPVLSGENAVVGEAPYGCPDIERLLSAIRDRLTAVLSNLDAGTK